MGKILVTGGAGFIGSHLVDGLVAKGYRVKVLDMFEPQVHRNKVPQYLNKKAVYIKGDVRNPKTVAKAIKDVDVVFHMAAQVGIGQSMYQVAKYVDHNMLGTAVLMEQIIKKRPKIKKVIVASSMSIYGEGSYRCPRCGDVEVVERRISDLKKKQWEYKCPHCGLVLKPVATNEEKRLKSSSIYAISKKDQEEIVLSLGKAYNIPSVALRFFNVYGPRQSLSNPYTGVCAIFSSRIKNDNPPLVYEDGHQTRDFIDVRDIVRACIFVMKNSKADYKYFNVGSGKPVSVLEIAGVLSSLYGKKPDVIIKNEFRVGDIRHCFADTSKIRKLGFRPLINFKQGMADLVKWGKREKSIDMVDKADKLLAKMKLKI